MSGLDLYQTQRALALLFVYAVIVGFCLGGVYDLLRILRLLCCAPRKGTASVEQGRKFSFGTVLLFWEDILFMLTFAVSLILLCYYGNDGRIRASAVIGIACGFFVYRQTVGRLVIRMAEILTAWIRKILAFLWRVASLPFRWFGRLISFLWRQSIGRAVLAHRRKVAESAARETDQAEEQDEDTLDTPHTHTHEMKPSA